MPAIFKYLFTSKLILTWLYYYIRLTVNILEVANQSRKLENTNI